jgi:hypothetical protein
MHHTFLNLIITASTGIGNGVAYLQTVCSVGGREEAAGHGRDYGSRGAGTKVFVPL